MTEISATESARRESWAQQENQRRQTEFQRAYAAWAEDDQWFQWMLTTARTGVGFKPGTVGTGFVPKRGESLFAEFADCRLIEVKRGPGAYHGGYSGFSFRISRGISYRVGGSRGSFVPGAEELQVTDEGQAAVSSTRVVFQGRLNSREWAYGKLISIQHDPTRPISLIHVNNRQKVSGISYPAEQAPLFRFALELGAAQVAGSTPMLVASIEAERAEHARMQPVRPQPVTPADAPVRGAGFGAALAALLTGKPGQSPARRVVHTAVAGGLMLLVFGAGASTMANVADGTAQPLVRDTPRVVTAGPVSTPVMASSPPSTAAVTTTPPVMLTSTDPSTPTVVSPSPRIVGDEPVAAFKAGAKPHYPTLLSTTATPVRVGAICRDGSESGATGRGACSWHHGVARWLYDVPYWVDEHKATNADRIAAYKAALKKWQAATAKNKLMAKYPCSKGTYKKGSPGYATWRDSNGDGIACEPL